MGVRALTVDCNSRVIVVAGSDAVHVLSWLDGALLHRFSSLPDPDGVPLRAHSARLLRDGSGVLVSDRDNHVVWTASVDGELRRVYRGVRLPYDAVESGDGGVIVAECTKVSPSGGVVASLPCDSRMTASVVQVLSDGRLVTRETSRRGRHSSTVRVRHWLVVIKTSLPCGDQDVTGLW